MPSPSSRPTPASSSPAHRAEIKASLAQVAGIEHVAAVTDPFETDRISADGRVGYAEISLDVPSTELGRPAAAEITEALQPARAGGVQAELGGDAAFLNAEKKSSPAEAVGLLAALVVLVVAFGTIVAALVPIVLALVAVAVGLLSVVVLAGSLEVSTAAPTIGAMVGLGVGIDYALLIVSRYRENRTAGQDNRSALSAAMGSSGTAVVFAGGTVVLAMIALVLTGVGFLASIGLSTSIVVLLRRGDRDHPAAGTADAARQPHRPRTVQPDPRPAPRRRRPRPPRRPPGGAWPTASPPARGPTPSPAPSSSSRWPPRRSP